jgi:N-acetylmuramoyl-L-alanine amidase
MTPRGVVLHTVGVRGDATVEAITDHHVRTNGWATNGYHWLVTKDGTAHRTPRRLDQAGAHTAGANDTLGVCVAGDGDSEPWRLAQWRGVLRLLVALCQEHGWSADQVCGHREAPRVFRATPTGKTCPGRLVDLDEVRSELAEALAAERSR